MALIQYSGPYNVLNTSFDLKFYIHFLSTAGYDIPKGTPITVNHYALHFDPDQWDEPNEFKPERFLNEDGKLGKMPQSFLPFSAGRRVCPAEVMAKVQLFCILTALMQNYKLIIPKGMTKLQCANEGGLFVTSPVVHFVEVEKRM